MSFIFDFSISFKISRCHSSVQKKIHGTKKAAIVLSVSYPIYWKYFKIYFITKLYHSLKKYFLNIKLVFKKVLIYRHIRNIRKIQKVFRSRKWICCVTYRFVENIRLLPHDLIIAKLHAYGFDMLSLRVMHSYLTDRYQRIKTNDST